MTIHSYRTLLREDGTPYLAMDREFQANGRRVYSAPDDLAGFVRDSLRLQDCAEEYLYLLCFDTAGHMIGCAEASHGTVNMSLVSNREILQKALLLGAVRIALAHNHPSGDTTPSSQDIEATASLKTAADILGISLIDHIIVSRNGWTSLKALGLL